MVAGLSLMYSIINRIPQLFSIEETYKNIEDNFPQLFSIDWILMDMEYNEANNAVLKS